MPEKAKENRVAIWKVFAGQALYDSDVEPMQISMQFDVVGALWAKHKYAWQAFLEAIEDNLRSEEA